MTRPEVFLSYASADKASVRTLALQLQQRSIQLWFDEWNLIPGKSFLDEIGQALRECSGCVVFLGPGETGPWQHEELRSALDLAARDKSYKLVPVLLPGADRERLSQLAPFLANRSLVEFSKGLDDSEALDLLVCGIPGTEPGPRKRPLAPGRNPYMGLLPFDVGDAPLFFGREALTDVLLARLDRAARDGSRFVSIVGPSGSGKSSLARAGLLARLAAGSLPGSAGWLQIIIRPGQDPLGSLSIGVVSHLDRSLDPNELVHRFKKGEEALHRQVTVGLTDRPDTRVVLLVDQAEEAFTAGVPASDRDAFFNNLAHAATICAGPTLVILSLRSDFFSRVGEHQRLAMLVSENQLLVPTMSEDERRRAIVLPAERAGRYVRPALVDELIGDSKDSLPLLEHALAQLWERPTQELGIEDYRGIGGIAGALDSRAEAIFETLDTAQKAACRRLFLRLIQPGEDALDTRRRIRSAELPPDQRAVSQVFCHEGVHLLTSSREGDQELVEVAHEELIRRWERLHQWAKEGRPGQRTHWRLTVAANEWSARPPDARDESSLYGGAALAEVERWLARLSDSECASVLNANESAFLEQSRLADERTRLEEERRLQEAAELRAKEQQRRREAEEFKRDAQNRFVVALVMSVLALGAGATAFAYANRANKANRQQAVALSRELTATVSGHLDGDPQLNLALLKEAHRLAETEELFPALAEWSGSLGRAELRGHSNWVRGASFSPDGLRVLTASFDNTARLWDAASGRPLAVLAGHTGPVLSATFSPDGLRVLTASFDNTARLWDAASGSPLAVLAGHSGWVRSAAFSPDGLRVLTVSDDKTARLWDTASGRPLATLSGHSRSVYSASFSPSGSRILTVSDDNTARLWDAASGSPLATLSGHNGPVLSAAFSPDGRRVVTASFDNTARLWDAASGSPLSTLARHSGWMKSAAFSPDGVHILTVSNDDTAQIWNASSGAVLATLASPSNLVYSAAFSPDGLRILTAGSDSTAQIWDVATGALHATLIGHSGPVFSVTFSADGRRVLTVSEDNTARLWDTASGEPLARLSHHSSSVRSAIFSPEGLRVLTIGDDNTVRLWDALSGKPLAILYRHGGWVRSAAFSPDGVHAITASDDDTARLWDASSGRPFATLSGHSDTVWSCAFSPDGLRALTASSDGTARLWDTSSGTPLATLSGHAGPVRNAAFSPDGHRVLTASFDHTARLWDASSGGLLATLAGHSGPVLSAAFSPDGRSIVTASSDDTARLWSAASGVSLVILSGHSGAVRSAAFSPDGRSVVTASDDGTARLWTAASGELRATLSGHTAIVWSATFSPDGLQVLTASHDHTARLWASTSGEPLAVLSGHTGPVRSATFSPDGLWILTASDDGRALLWDAASRRAVATLPSHSGPMRSAAFSPDGLRIITVGDDSTALVWQDLLWAPRHRQLEVLSCPREMTSDERRTYLHE